MAQLPNYLRSHRKRLALTQDEVAFLLGNKDGSKSSRHENFAREPSLITALAYEAVFQRPVRELFGGLYQTVEKDVVARTKILMQRVDCGKTTRQTARKRHAFESIITSPSNRILS